MTTAWPASKAARSVSCVSHDPVAIIKFSQMNVAHSGKKLRCPRPLKVPLKKKRRLNFSFSFFLSAFDR